MKQFFSTGNAYSAIFHRSGYSGARRVHGHGVHPHAFAGERIERLLGGLWIFPGIVPVTPAESGFRFRPRREALEFRLRVPGHLPFGLRPGIEHAGFPAIPDDVEFGLVALGHSISSYQRSAAAASHAPIKSFRALATRHPTSGLPVGKSALVPPDL